MPQSRQPINIYCASCGMPARFDIARQVYTCAYCGADTGIRESLAEKQGFRKLHKENLQTQKREYPLSAATCTGCGAEVVFPENEALTHCAFCGRALARREYLGVDGFPEVLIPFRLTQDDAKARLLAWCKKNPGREAKELRQHADELMGFYLPYELVKGPTSCEVRRKDTSRSYRCRGFLEGSFVNTSKQLNNLLLDGTEPYELSDLKEFSFSYLAGQRVKMRDLGDEETAARVSAEIAADYEPYLSPVMETRAIQVEPSTDALVEMGAVLPMYYLRTLNTMAAVNGQTGKVAVREAKDRYLLPWWLKPPFWTALIVAAIFAVMYFFGVEMMGCLLVAGMMTVFLLIVLFTAYHNKYGGDGRQKLPRRILTSDDSEPRIEPPEMCETVDGQERSAKVKFTTPLRVLKMLGIALGIVFLPLILAFIFNGFSAQGLTFGGAAVWLCITVPLTPVLLIQFARLEIYEHPLIWTLDGEGRWSRLRSKKTEKRRLRDFFKPIVLIPLGIALAVLTICTYLVLHWDAV